MSWFPLYFCPSVLHSVYYWRDPYRKTEGQCNLVINVTFYETLIDYCPMKKTKQSKTEQTKPQQPKTSIVIYRREYYCENELWREEGYPDCP